MFYPEDGDSRFSGYASPRVTNYTESQPIRRLPPSEPQISQVTTKRFHYRLISERAGLVVTL
jgi:hypothetical protein